MPAKSKSDQNKNIERRLEQSQKLQILFAILGILVFCLAGYSNVLTQPGDFILDDYSCLIENDRLAEFSPLWNVSSDTPVGFWRRPVPSWTFTLNYRMGGHDILQYRVFNLLVHIATALLLFDLIRRVVQLNQNTAVSKYGIPFAFSITCLWAIHPIQTETVTYVIQRIEALMGLFFVASMYCYFRGSQSQTSWPWYLGSIACCWLGMGSKEVMITLPVVLLAFDWTFLWTDWKTFFKQRLWVYGGFSIAVVWLLLAVFAVAPEVQQNVIVDRPVTRWEYFSTQPQVIFQYLLVVFWPAAMCFDRNWPIAEHLTEIAIPGTLLTICFLASIVGLVRRSALGWLGFSFFAILAPTSSVMPIATVYFEHRIYLPLVCFLILLLFAVVWLSHKYFQQHTVKILLAVSIIWSAMLCAATHWRNGQYQSFEDLMADTVRKDPGSWRALQNLGTEKFRKGQTDNAIEYLERSAAIYPPHRRVIVALTTSYCAEKQFDKAIMRLNELRESFGENPGEYHHQMAMAYSGLNDWNQCHFHYSKAVTLMPERQVFWVNYLNDCLKFQKLEIASKTIEQATAKHPTNVELLLLHGSIIMFQKRPAKEAIQKFEQALQLDPYNKRAQQFLLEARRIESQQTGNR